MRAARDMKEGESNFDRENEKKNTKQKERSLTYTCIYIKNFSIVQVFGVILYSLHRGTDTMFFFPTI